MLYATWNLTGGAYASTSVANAVLAHHQDTFSDDEDMRRAMEASRRDATAGPPRGRAPAAAGGRQLPQGDAPEAVRAPASPAVAGSEEEQVRQAQEASLRELEEVRLARQNRYNRANAA